MPHISHKIPAWFSPIHRLLPPAPSRRWPEPPSDSGWPVHDGLAAWAWLKRQVRQYPGAHAALARSLDQELRTALPAWLRLEDGWQVIGRDCLEGCTLLHPRDGHVAHVTRDGRSGTLALSLPEWLAMLCELPTWRDVVEFSAGGDLASMRELAALLQPRAPLELEHLDEDRALLASTLRLAPGTWPDRRPGVSAVDRLHHALTQLPAPQAWVDGHACIGLAGLRGPEDWARLEDAQHPWSA